MLKRLMNQHEFDIWVKNSVASLMQETERNQKIGYLTDPMYKTCMIINKKTGKVAVAKCSPEDTFSEVVGLAVAWAKFRNRPIPIVGKTVGLNLLKPNDVFSYKHNRYRLVQTLNGLGTHGAKRYAVIVSLCDNRQYCIPESTLVIKECQYNFGGN